MIKKLAFITLFFPVSVSFAFLLPPETILQNNVSQRAFLRSAVIQHQILFLEGFFSPTAFSCKETMFFSAPESLRVDYLCDNVAYGFIRTSKNLRTIYEKKVENRELTPFNYWPSLFLLPSVNALIKNLSHFRFISAEEEILNDKKSWSIDAAVSLVKLGKIEKSTPQKLEKNTTLLLSGSSGKTWFEKDLFLPQKIEYEGRDLVFKNYKEYPLKGSAKLSFKYPQKIEIQESQIAGIILDTSSITLNPSLDPNVFNSAPITKKNVTAFSEENSRRKEVLEKFIVEYR